MRWIKLLTSLCLVFFCLQSISQRPGAGNIDSAKQVAFKYYQSDSTFINTSFYIAEKYMMLDLYDSTQVWLNYISERLPARKPSYLNFYLSTYQASTYYYTGLIRMALQESERMLRIAKEIKDSVLLGTAYNLIGLSYMNMDSTKRAIPFFLEGIKYIKQPPYKIDYLTSSKPHHMWGNLAECYIKLQEYEKGKTAANNSKKLATEIGWLRGAAIANNNLGQIYAQTQQLDSAIFFEKEAIALALSKNQPDVALVSYSNLAECFLLTKQNDSTLYYLDKGFLLLQEKPYLNDLFVKEFLGDVENISVILDKPYLQVKALRLKDSITNGLVKKNDAQISILVKGSVANEMRAANLEIAEAKQKQALSNTRFLIALVTIISLIVLFFVYRYYHAKQLKEIKIRNQISQDLHDDIGATLSSINIYGELAHAQLANEATPSKEMIEKITVQTKDLMSRMGDVIWSMKPADEEKNSFASRLTNYSSELLTPKNIIANIIVEERIDNKIHNPVVRKNILLIVKEAMNNISKYSEATRVDISLKEVENEIVLSVCDNGTGFKNNSILNGNGIENMKKRCEQFSGKFSIASQSGEGVSICCTFPITIISHFD